MDFYPLFLLLTLHRAVSLMPPKFQWKTIDFAWEGQTREAAIAAGDFIPENNMPTGLARWKDKLFITIPRWRKGVPSSLNVVYLNGTQQQPLNPYPSWPEGFVSHKYCCTSYNSTVVSAFRAHVDQCDRLWVVDNGISDISDEIKKITDPAILIFDLNTDMLMRKYVLPNDVLQESSVLTGIVVDALNETENLETANGKDKDVTEKASKKGKDVSAKASKKCIDATEKEDSTTKDDCNRTFAYITDSGSNAIIVYSLNENTAWRVENHYFRHDPRAVEYKVGGIEFYVSDGISGTTLSQKKSDGFRDLYFFPTSSTKQFKMSTKLLRNKDVAGEDIFNGAEIVGDRGSKSQATACDFDPKTNVLFYTQMNKNGVGCWNTDKPFNEENTPVVFSDCNLLEFPNDIKVDQEGNLWILSDRQPRFLSGNMDFTQVNFRVLTAPVDTFIEDTACACLIEEKPKKQSAMSRALSFIKRPKSAKSGTKIK